MMPSGPRGDRRIRVIYVITDLERGGVPLHLYRLATRMSHEQFDIGVISLADVGPVGRMLQDAGVPVSACGGRSIADISVFWRLIRLLRAARPDILHSLLFHANVACRLAGPVAGVPGRRIISEIQTAEIERRWHLVVDNLTCRLCRFEIGNSPSVVAHLRRHAHVPGSRLVCQWGAVDAAEIEAAQPARRADFGLSENEPVIIWVGRLDPIKGFEEMLEAFAGVCRSAAARLVLVGEGDYRPAVESLIVKHRLHERVILLGQRTDVPALLKMADLFLFCSRTEGLPNAMLEAMAAGLPVIATDVSGCRDILTDGETGFLVRPGDAGEIMGAVLRILADPGVGRAMGRAAREWVCRRADLRNLAARWEQLYCNIA